MKDKKPDIMESAAPYIGQLLETARHDLAYHEHRGDLEPGDLTPEEVLGEVLIAASDGWDKRPESVSMRLWLFRLENTVMHSLIAQEAENRGRWAFSMEEPVPDLPVPFGDDIYWDWDQPDEEDRWEDALFGFEPVAEELVEEAEEISRDLEPVQRRVWLLYEKQGFSIPDIARIVHLPSSRVAGMVRDAGAVLQERLVEKTGQERP